MANPEERIREIYSYYIDECYSDDYSGSFLTWLQQSMYGEEYWQVFNQRLEEYKVKGRPISVWEKNHK
jgi:hypothetical protein